jgi:UDP-glucose 4-epimerase
MSSLKGKKILVTGGAGFIGSFIVESLVEAGARITVFDNFSSGFEENLSRVKQDVEVVKGDILDKAALERVMKGQEVVSHQAAQLEILKAMDDPVDDLTTNTIGTLNVLRACVKAGVERFIAPSSAGVYGQAQFTPETEEHPTEPQWAYGVSKLACEKYAKIFEWDHGLKQTMLRYAIVYGPREWFGRVLTIFLRQLAHDKPPVVFGDGQQVRDFVFVKDVVDFHNQCLVNEATVGQVYNVSSGTGTTVAELARLCIAVSGKGLEPLFEELAEGQVSAHVPGRKRIPSELKTLIQSTEKATRDTGWQPRTSLRSGLEQQWRWLLDNKGRYQFETMRV